MELAFLRARLRVHLLRVRSFVSPIVRIGVSPRNSRQKLKLMFEAPTRSRFYRQLAALISADAQAPNLGRPLPQLPKLIEVLCRNCHQDHANTRASETAGSSSAAAAGPSTPS
tara:strand:- start:1115 stop:1453 length:339 start_codon:yes stop_codon:yes gene_type:complete